MKNTEENPDNKNTEENPDRYEKSRTRMNSTAHVRPESEISLEQGVCCAVWGRQTTMQMRANQFLARIQSCSQHAVDSQSTTTAKDLQNQYKIKMYLYKSTCTIQDKIRGLYTSTVPHTRYADKKSPRVIHAQNRTSTSTATADKDPHVRGSGWGRHISF